jgi:hypothetical protein
MKGGIARELSRVARRGAVVACGPSSVFTDHGPKGRPPLQVEDRKPGAGGSPRCCHRVPTIAAT